MPKSNTCDECSGHGRTYCTNCQGSGSQPGVTPLVPCKVCNGARWVTCQSCGGSGKK